MSHSDRLDTLQWLNQLQDQKTHLLQQADKLDKIIASTKELLQISQPAPHCDDITDPNGFTFFLPRCTGGAVYGIEGCTCPVW